MAINYFELLASLLRLVYLSREYYIGRAWLWLLNRRTEDRQRQNWNICEDYYSAWASCTGTPGLFAKLTH